MGLLSSLTSLKKKAKTAARSATSRATEFVSDEADHTVAGLKTTSRTLAKASSVMRPGQVKVRVPLDAAAKALKISPEKLKSLPKIKMPKTTFLNKVAPSLTGVGSIIDKLNPLNQVTKLADIGTSTFVKILKIVAIVAAVVLGVIVIILFGWLIISFLAGKGVRDTVSKMHQSKMDAIRDPNAANALALQTQARSRAVTDTTKAVADSGAAAIIGKLFA